LVWLKEHPDPYREKVCLRENVSGKRNQDTDQSIVKQATIYYG